MKRFTATDVFRAAAALVVACLCASPALAQSDQQKLVNDARATLSNFMRDPDQTWIHDNISRARALLISPQIVKAGFIFGGSGGRAVLVTRSGQVWVGPAFYNLATASVGFQAGLDVSEAVIMVMTDRGLNSLMSASLKVGGDASISAGPIGAGANSTVTSDLVSFTRSKGIYGGLNLDGTVITPNHDWNAAYFSKPGVQPPDILVRHIVHNDGAKPLLADITAVMKK